MMLLRHFELREQPFGVTPDPRFLYATPTHREALSSLLYGLESGLGFVSLIAQPGMGKTTLLFEALRRVDASTKSVFLFQTITSPIELFQALLMDVGVKEVGANLIEMQSQLNEALVSHHSTGRRLVVVIDEAQNLNLSVLESIRMLSNFETAGQKLLQIIVSGQPQLAKTLSLPELLQLRQRISIFARLEPLSSTETAAYIQHRLRIAGSNSPEAVFTKAALALIGRGSEGIPRNINNICFNALSLGYALQRKSLDVDVIEEVLRDLDVNLIHGAGLPNTPEAPPSDAPQGPVLFTSQRPTSLPIAQPRTRMSRATVWALSLVAICCLLLLALSASWIERFRAESPAKPVQADAAARTVAASIETAAAPTPASLPVPAASRVRAVRVRKHQTIYGICDETFGKCTPAILRQIMKLNPTIINLGRISDGQTVLVPQISQVQ